MHYQKFYFFNFMLRNKAGLIKEQLTYTTHRYNYCFRGNVRICALKMPSCEKNLRKVSSVNFLKIFMK